MEINTYNAPVYRAIVENGTSLLKALCRDFGVDSLEFQDVFAIDLETERKVYEYTYDIKLIMKGDIVFNLHGKIDEKGWSFVVTKGCKDGRAVTTPTIGPELKGILENIFSKLYS